MTDLVHTAADIFPNPMPSTYLSLKTMAEEHFGQVFI